MSCYYPLLGEFLGYDKESGKPRYKIHAESEYVRHDPRDIQVPCGHCIGCRLDHSREWANRCVLELDHHSGKALFITLTYSPEHVPIGSISDDGTPVYSLYKKHFQDFMKRLRYYFSEKQIRFFACGEYGGLTLRPHYHAIIYGLTLDDFPDYIQFGKNEFGQLYYSSEKLNCIWSFGFTSIAKVSWQTCAYVARYNAKLYSTDNLLFDSLGIDRPFILMSRRPGIGSFYAEDHPDVLDKPYVYIDDSEGVTKHNEIRLPKYLFNKLELTDPEKFANIKLLRKRAGKDAFLSQLKKTDKSEFEYRKVQESYHLRAAKKLQGFRKEL